MHTYVFLFQTIFCSATVLRFTIVLQCTRIHIHMSVDARAVVYCMQIHFPMFAEVKLLQQQNMRNVHHMHISVCRLFRWNYEQRLYGFTFIPTIIRIARTNASLNDQKFCQILLFHDVMPLGRTSVRD